MIRVVLAWICLVGSALAHPIAATIGEGHWRPKRGVIEVSLRLPTHDVQAALGGKRVDEESLQALIRKGFSVDGAVLGWVGSELKPESTWVYFEVPGKAGQALVIRNHLLFARSTQQVNTLNLTLGAQRVTLQWSAGEPTQRVTLP